MTISDDECCEAVVRSCVPLTDTHVVPKERGRDGSPADVNTHDEVDHG